jgi:predicted DNA-binding transcriptional regulator AlpA
MTEVVQLLRIDEACRASALPRSTFYYFSRTDPTFPQIIKLGKRTSAVSAADLARWVESRRQAGTQAA